MVVTRSAELAEEVRSTRHYGQRSKYLHERLPLNRRLDTLQAAVVQVKLPHLDSWNARRQTLADAYRERLAGLPVGLPAAEPFGRHIYHLFVITLAERDHLRAALLAERIETGIHYPIPLHRLPALVELGYPAGAFPNAEWLPGHSLSLPMYPELPLAHVDRVASNEAWRRPIGFGVSWSGSPPSASHSWAVARRPPPQLRLLRPPPKAH